MAKRFKLRENQPIPLPFLSLQQVGDVTPDPTRRLCPAIYERVGETYNPDGTIKGAYVVQWPLPYQFSYQFELWVKTRMEARRYVGLYADRFEHADYTYILVDHGDGMGRRLVRVENQGIADNTSLETGQEQRSLRWTMSVIVHGWRPRKIKEVPVVRQVNITIEEPT
jgi:hypothetical protein